MNEVGCEEMRLLVQADLDGELSVTEAAALEQHLQGCAGCRAAWTESAALSRRLRAEVPRFEAPAALRDALHARLVPPPRHQPRRWPRFGRAAGAAAAMALAASVALLLPQGGTDDGTEVANAVANHVRALQPGHLTDVLSSDQHTVKPWFAGRIDYAPPVRDFAAAGFPLLGGRLDYLRRPIAALVYRHDKHLIDLFIWPETAGSGPRSGSVDGYNLVGWSQGGMRFAAVSDLNSAELAIFAKLWQAD